MLFLHVIHELVAHTWEELGNGIVEMGGEIEINVVWNMDELNMDQNGTHTRGIQYSRGDWHAVNRTRIFIRFRLLTGTCVLWPSPCVHSTRTQSAENSTSNNSQNKNKSEKKKTITDPIQWPNNNCVKTFFFPPLFRVWRQDDGRSWTPCIIIIGGRPFLLNSFCFVFISLAQRCDDDFSCVRRTDIVPSKGRKL